MDPRREWSQAGVRLAEGRGMSWQGEMTRPAVLFIHGAANGAWVWEPWRRHLTALGWETIVIDLRGHGRSLPIDMSEVTMEDYVADVESVTRQVVAAQGVQPVIAGWSMGGLVALMYAAKHPETPGLVLFSPSMPVEVGGRMSIEELREIPPGPVGPDHYGIYADDLEASRPGMFGLTDEEAGRVLANSAGALESGFARRQRHRGIAVAASEVRMPSLVVYGDSEKEPRPTEARRLAIYLGGESIGAPGAGHWGIVYSEGVVSGLAPVVDGWLRREVGE